MKRNKKQNIRLLALILILLLGIGFAALAANLKINGTVNVAKTSWDVHFENVSITEGSVTANPAPTSNNTDTTEMTYTINFTKPGDYFEFTTDIVNEGTIDAMVDVVSNNAYANVSSTTPITLPSYLTNTVTYSDGVEILPNQLLAHDTSEKIKVRVEFKKDISSSDLPSSGDTSIVFKFKGDYKQADENAEDRPTKKWIISNGKTATALSVGDEICLKDDSTQCFNFLHYDGTNNEDIVMLAKYNLKVGSIYAEWEKIGEYTSYDDGYGLQSSEARGYVEGASTYNGTSIVSRDTYWDDKSSNVHVPNSNYPGSYYPGPNYPTIYDPINFCGEPDTNTFSVAFYVEGYKTKLENDYDVTIKDTRLLTYAEATDSSIGCDQSSHSCPTTGFITNTTFWLGSAGGSESVWGLESNGGFRGISLYDDYSWGGLGVRPVLVISKSDV